MPLSLTTCRPATPHEAAVTLATVLPGPPEAVFAFITAEDVLPKILHRWGPLPAVAGTSDLTGPWTRAGSSRTVHLAGGHTVREQLTRHEPPGAEHGRPHGHFAYRVSDISHPLLRLLASHARGDWHFEPAAGGTHVRWTYTFTARHPLAAPALAGFARWLWRAYMAQCLALSRARLAA